MTIEGNSTTLTEMVSGVCSEITSGSTFTYDGSTYQLSSSLKVDGTEYYGVNCEMSQVCRKSQIILIQQEIGNLQEKAAIPTKKIV